MSDPKTACRQTQISSPRVSVLVICYNQAETIGQSLDSVLSQDCPFDFEIIIGDDASSDNTREICLEYVRRFPSVIRLLPPESNMGLVRNYFRCLRAARGEYIADCAGDDYWISSDKLSRAVRALDSDSNLSVAFSDIEILDTSTGARRKTGDEPSLARWRRSTPIPGREMMYGLLNRTDRMPYVLSAAVYRKSSLMEVMEPHPELVCVPEMRCEDFPIMTALASRGDAIYLDGEPSICYREDPSGVSHGDSAKISRFYSAVFGGTPALLKGYGIPESECRAHFEKMGTYILAEALKSRDAIAGIEACTAVGKWNLAPTGKMRMYIVAIRHPLAGMLVRWLKRHR